MLDRHRCCPVTLSTAERLPALSGKYTVSPSTAGVADTSPPVENSHFFCSPATLLTLIDFSPACHRVLRRSPPAEFHSPPPAAALPPPPSGAPVTGAATTPPLAH